MINIPLIIFAGGKSSRMGRDKALLPFGGFDTLAQYQQERFKGKFKDIYISTKEDKFDFNYQIIADRYTDSSPLVAIISIFEILDTDRVFILSVDAPFVDTKTINHLISQDTDKADTTIAKSPNGTEPLCGIYHKSILPKALKQLKQNNHRLNDLLRLSNTTTVQFEDNRVFTNLNYIDDYRGALIYNKS